MYIAELVTISREWRQHVYCIAPWIRQLAWYVDTYKVREFCHTTPHHTTHINHQEIILAEKESMPAGQTVYDSAL